MTTIKIYNHRKELALTTNEQTYENDLKNLEQLYWNCTVEYEGENVGGYDYPYNHNGQSPRLLARINGRSVYARYTFFADEYEIDKNKILNALNEDFKTTLQCAELRKIDRERWEYLRKTSKPTNTRLQPVASEALAELKDE